MDKKLLDSFTKKNCKRKIKQSLGQKKNNYCNWKGYDNLFSSWIDKGLVI